MIETILRAAVIPAALAVAVALLWRRLAPARVAQTYAIAVSFAVAMLVGYLLGTPGNKLVPQRHWQWIAYLGVAGALLGPVIPWRRSPWPAWLLAVVPAFAAVLLVPHWPDLAPSRPVSVWLVALYLVSISMPLAALTLRLPAAGLLAALAATAIVAALAILGLVSVTYGTLASTAAAALAGCSVAAYRDRELSAYGMGVPFALVVGGWSYVAAIEPRPMNPAFLLIPLAPLAAWMGATVPRGRQTASRWVAAAAFLVALVFALGTVIVPALTNR